MSYLSWPVSQIATEIPGATAILFKHKINFCCDGGKSLEQALLEKNIDAIQIVNTLTEIKARSSTQEDWQTLNNHALIEHIITRYHNVHRQQLEELQRLAKRVETVHSAHPLCPTGLANHLATLSQELEQHMQKEEAILFPMLSNNPSPMVNGPISVMRAEHEDHMADIEKIYQLTQDVTPHSDACNTWRALYVGLQEFISDIHAHINLENNVLFARTSNH